MIWDADNGGRKVLKELRENCENNNTLMSHKDM
jgi:hypothetical protein